MRISKKVWFLTETEFKAFMSMKAVGGKVFKGTFFCVEVDRVISASIHPRDLKVR